ncbi:HIT family protein [Thermoleophilum album]|uniref:Diadenosine tetraphosphate (Ap4A) hydrolase n=1 Tax=Thermoleophilum album TaxID=29539 RepID=A0A1H6FVT7_THEAL|nr:HIT domain-containing protein [Thermoleophilum album]SEH14268.1 Diadenosine tetraphosphate (Ap4A) hydrolase [Thermoleophilum album]
MNDRPLWAPWRIAYIRGPKAGECIFCTKPASADDRANYLLQRGDHCFVLLNAYPYAPGHLMVAPYRHIGDFERLHDDEALELVQLTQRAIRALKVAFRPDGFNVGLNLGKVAGAGFGDHLHLHVVPRWEGDNNFMPVIADTRVINQSLEAAYAELAAAWPREEAGSGAQRETSRAESAPASD